MRPIRSQHGLIVILAHVPQVARLIALATMLAGLSAVAFSWQPVPLPLPAELTEAEASAPVSYTPLPLPTKQEV